MSKSDQTSHNQSGMVSFLIVLVLMTILALISIGFSRLMNREARQALDRQLSTTAYYAAESGVNDARNYISLGGSSTSTCDTDSLTDVNPSPFVQHGNISGSDANSRYSCVVTNKAPHELIYFLKAGESAVFKINLSNMDNLYLSWQNQSYPGGSPQPLDNFSVLPREDLISPNGTGVLRTAVYPLHNSDRANANNELSQASRSYFLYPEAGGGGGISAGQTVDYTDISKNGAFVHGNCNTPNYPILPYTKSKRLYCNSRVSNLAGAGDQYSVRLTAEYAPIVVSVQASDSGNNSLAMPEAQAVLDVTGAGTDVLSRIQSRVPLGDTYQLPGYGLQSMEAICKVFRGPVVAQGQYGQPGLENGVPNNDGACTSPFNVGAIEGGGTPGLDSNPCPSPFIGTQPNCALPSCPPDSNGTYPACTCNPPSTGSPGSCVPAPTTCTDPNADNFGGPLPCTYPPMDCGDYGGFVSGDSSGWHAEVTGNNPCGVGISQCDVFGAGPGYPYEHDYGNANPVDDSDSHPGSVACQTIDGRWL